jgi:hypothetical protein
MNEPIENFSFSEDGEYYTKLCMEVTVYWRGSAFDKPDSIILFYKRAVAEIGAEIKFFETGSMSGAKKLRKDTLAMVPFWFKDPARRRDIYRMNLEGGAHPNEPSDHAICIVADEDDDEPVGLAKLCLPVAYGAETPDKLLRLVKDLVRDADFESGHAGYSLNWDRKGDYAAEATQRMGQIAARFWGIDFFSLFTTLLAMRKTKPSGIKRVNWLTFLGASLTERLGATATFESKLSSECEVHCLSNGILIKAGDHPTTGDRNSPSALAPYRSVGKLLAPFRFTNHKPFFGSPDDPASDSSTRWLARFDG